MAAPGLLIAFWRHRGLVQEPRRPVRTLVRHDTYITARAQFYDEAGVARDLTGKTVRYTLRDIPTQTLIVNRLTASLENQTTNAGQAYYTYLTAHVANMVESYEEWELEHTGGAKETFPVGLPQLVRIIGDQDAT